MAMNLSFEWIPQDILAARDRYLENSSEMQRERAAFASGRMIAAGHAEPENLGAIIDWKSSRPKRRIMTGNTANEIAEALRVAVRAEQARTAVGVLYGLNGVDVAMASAILTAIDPETYTVIDWRALNALGVEKSWLTVDDYLQYLGFCKAKAGELGIRLRDLDQALWVLGGT
ncbi:MAG: hypothetical protein ACLGXA_18275 [Acidobacteriota bacterium]